MSCRRLLALDFGESRIGVAIAIEGIGMPVGVVPYRGFRNELKALVRDRNPDIIVVGLPLAKSGRFTESTGKATAFAENVRKLLKTDVCMIDERLTTRAARSKSCMSGRQFKEARDALSALEIVNSYLANPETSIPIRLSFPECRIEDLSGTLPERTLVWCPPTFSLVEMLFEKGIQHIELYSENPQILLRASRAEIFAVNVKCEIDYARYDAILLQKETLDPTGGSVKEIIRFSCS